MVIVDQPAVKSAASNTVQEEQTYTDKQGGNIDTSRMRRYRVGGTRVIPEKEFPENREDLVASSNNLTDGLGVNTYCVPSLSDTKVIIAEGSKDIHSLPEKQSENGRSLTDEGGINTHFLNTDKYSYPESNGGKVIPDDEYLPPVKQSNDVLDYSDFRDIQEKRKIKTQQIEEDQNVRNRCESDLNDILTADKQEEQLEPHLKENPDDTDKVSDLDHFKDLIQEGDVKYLSHVRVKRQCWIPYFEYHHHYLVIVANDEGMTILHLTTDRLLNLVCRKEYIDFSNKTQCNNLLNFDLGVELMHRYEMPTKETDLEAIEERIQKMCRVDYVEYSLTSPEKWYCESLVSYVMTGKKDFREVEECIKRFGYRAEIIIFGINNFCMVQSITRRVWCRCKEKWRTTDLVSYLHSLNSG
ncbi:uncharacterized protein LOC134281312 [Saccostrea cucullata]|uniref:uncharacterized protein LOC134281312 n=1 Tax=Saccostrea cuccullata TaxID=36930 RepID=UPI002ED51956